jgi:hypothetical protein
LCLVSGLPRLRLDGIWTGYDVCPGLIYARLDLLIRFVPGLVGGTLQIRGSLLQGVYLLGNAHELSLIWVRRSAEEVVVPGQCNATHAAGPRNHCLFRYCCALSGLAAPRMLRLGRRDGIRGWFLRCQARTQAAMLAMSCSRPSRAAWAAA